ncbi:hypothetical protein A2837_02090 [Candidatus Kaiserbacteria bacterium RIFCSPHIGHO2_01_FULL_46_22]|uniref:Ada DNA repair metal-binding domain-containing protein n=1 Tax=Candidatus Kaiserbacteria bacterium RIFCSPHIGHO2_01_FULL_46_22 TaxID=1798475 RepID=A0A1F6BZN5_9BACT|nr:MAG: hypothetical protein A2837_02090 [Candidatus Kaiserbacteria bacterium RIFCSPHIGHO2_01_FULL_46_22]
MSDILQEIKEKINRLLADTAFFTAGLLILVAIASFGLGRQSVSPAEGRKGVTSPEEAKQGPVAPLNKGDSAFTSSDTSETDTFYVASKNGEVYHLPYCSGAKRISEQNKVIFKTKAEAEAAGLRPAANCPGI